MELNEFLYHARRITLDMAKLTLETASDESIKKEPKIQHKIVSTALALLVEAETLEKELDTMLIFVLIIVYQNKSDSSRDF